MITLMLALLASDPTATKSAPAAAPAQPAQTQTQAQAPTQTQTQTQGPSSAQTSVRTPPEQTVQATLRGCATENGRLVCTYAVPQEYEMSAQGEAAPPAGADAARVFAADIGVLTDAEKRLVARCADAGWMALCLPNDRREARALKARADAYEQARLNVTRLLGQDRCEDAVRSALEGGHLNLARQAREFCAPVVARPAPATSF